MQDSTFPEGVVISNGERVRIWKRLGARSLPYDDDVEKYSLGGVRVGRSAARFHQLGKAVIGVVVIDRARCNEFVLHKNRGRHLPLVEDVETDSNQVVAITLWEIRH